MRLSPEGGDKITNYGKEKTRTGKRKQSKQNQSRHNLRRPCGVCGSGFRREDQFSQ
jgi:hypothetical protein